MIKIIKENTILKLYLINLIEELENNIQHLEGKSVKSSENQYLKHYVKDLKKYCEDALLFSVGYEIDKKEKIDLTKIFKEENKNE